jgi:hypothetical protein
MIFPVDEDEVWTGGSSPSDGVLVIAGLGAGLSRLRFQNGQGLIFKGREFVIQDVDLVLEPGPPSSAIPVALVVSGAGSLPVRVRLVRVRVFAPVGMGIVLMPGTRRLDASFEDVEIEAGTVGLFWAGADSLGPNRVVLRASRIAAPQPAICSGSGLSIRDARLQSTAVDVPSDEAPSTACLELAGRVESVRLNRVHCEGFVGRAVGLRLPSSETAPSEDVQLVGVTASESVPSLVGITGETSAPGVHGLWLDLCSRLYTGVPGNDATSSGWVLHEDAAAAADAGVGRVSGQYNRAGPGPIASRGGVGIQVDGAAARLASGLGADILRATSDLLPGGEWAALGGDGAVVSVVQQTVLDTVVGLVDVDRVVVGANGVVLLRAFVPDVEPGSRAVFSVYLRTAAPSHYVDARVYVAANATTIGGSRLLRFRVRPYWQRFTASVAYMPEGGGALLSVVMLDPVTAGASAEVLLAAPQFELGDTPTPPCHRDSEEMGGGFVPLQAFRLGNEPISYARNEEGVDPNAPLGRRTLNLEPKGGADVDGWVITSQGVKGYNPLNTTPGVEECGPT